jgi:hypothetical protein
MSRNKKIERLKNQDGVTTQELIDQGLVGEYDHLKDRVDYQEENKKK